MTHALTKKGQEGRGAADERPFCVRCRRLMQRNGESIKGRRVYACRPCKAYCVRKTSRSICARRNEDLDQRPRCVACRGVMNPQRDDRPGHVPRWKCEACRVSCRQRSARGVNRVRRLADLDLRPWCVSCRRVMTTEGLRSFMCKGCNARASALRAGGYRAPRGDLKRPLCPQCGHPKSSRLKRGVQYFACQRCGRRRRRMRESPDAAAALLKEIASALPTYLSLDERADAAQSIMLDVLAGQLAPRVPSAAALRRYAREARGMASDRYKFVSLSQPTLDGREFGETLAA